MEYVEGRLLKDIVAEGPLDPDEAVRVTEGILTALEYSHRAGVVHRDIKPGNVMLTHSGQVKVMDFGIARAISDSAATVAQTTAILGTAQYFSPEQARGETVDARTDLYSTGVMLFELLTGRAAVPRRLARRGRLPARQRAARPAEHDQPGGVSPALDAVVLHALAKDRFDRFQSAAEFRDDLEAAGAGRAPARRPHARRRRLHALRRQPALAPPAARPRCKELAVRRHGSTPPHADPPAGRLDLGGHRARRPSSSWPSSSGWSNLTPPTVDNAAVVTVPNLVGVVLRQRRGRARRPRPRPPSAPTSASETVDDGDIISTDPDPGTSVPKDAAVTRHRVVRARAGASRCRPWRVDRRRRGQRSPTPARRGLSRAPTTRPTVPAGSVISSDPAAARASTLGQHGRPRGLERHRAAARRDPAAVRRGDSRPRATSSASPVTPQRRPRLHRRARCRGSVRPAGRRAAAQHRRAERLPGRLRTGHAVA